MKPRPPISNRALRFAASFACLALVSAAPADDFRPLAPGSAPAGWTTFGIGAWSIVKQGSASAYQAGSSEFPGAFASTRSFAPPGSAGGFAISTTFRITRGTAYPGGEYIGIAALATGPNLAASSYYVADVQRGSGILRIVSLGADNPDFSAEKSEAFVATLEANVDYTLTLAGSTAPDGGLALKLTLSDGATSRSVVAKDPTPHAGRHFGPRLNNVTKDDPLQVCFADFVFTPTATAAAR